MKKFFIFAFLSMTVYVVAAERSPQWESVRKKHLTLQPVCQLCGIAKDLQVHHLKPFSLFPELELEESNLITLCISKYWEINCHFIAGHGFNFKYFNPWTLEDIQKLKIIASPKYIKDHGTRDRDAYLNFIRVRVKEYNKNLKEIKQ